MTDQGASTPVPVLRAALLAVEDARREDATPSETARIVTEAVLDAMQALSVEQRMEAMGMAAVHVGDFDVVTMWVAPDDVAKVTR